MQYAFFCALTSMIQLPDPVKNNPARSIFTVMLRG